MAEDANGRSNVVSASPTGSVNALDPGVTIQGRAGLEQTALINLAMNTVPLEDRMDPETNPDLAATLEEMQKEADNCDLPVTSIEAAAYARRSMAKPKMMPDTWFLRFEFAFDNYTIAPYSPPHWDRT